MTLIKIKQTCANPDKQQLLQNSHESTQSVQNLECERNYLLRAAI